MESDEKDLDELEATEDVDLEDLEDHDLEDDALPPAPDEDEAEEDSLEELLDQRASGRRAPDERDEDEDIMSLVVDRPEPVSIEPLPSKVVPIKDRQEFVCNNCHLVKARVQLADESKGLCRDCV